MRCQLPLDLGLFFDVAVCAAHAAVSGSHQSAGVAMAIPSLKLQNQRASAMQLRAEIKETKGWAANELCHNRAPKPHSFLPAFASYIQAGKRRKTQDGVTKLSERS